MMKNTGGKNFLEILFLLVFVIGLAAGIMVIQNPASNEALACGVSPLKTYRCKLSSSTGDSYCEKWSSSLCRWVKQVSFNCEYPQMCVTTKTGCGCRNEF